MNGCPWPCWSRSPASCRAEIGQASRQLADTIASTRRLHVVESEPEPIADGTQPMPPAPAIRFEDVRFAYPGRGAWRRWTGVTFDIRPGSTVALVGASGAGKSTVANLLLRFWDPQSGPDHPWAAPICASCAWTICASTSPWSRRTPTCSTTRWGRTSAWPGAACRTRTYAVP